MASSTATMAKAVLLAVVLMQCCNAILAARPLLGVAAPVAGSDGGWPAMIMQMLKGGSSAPPTHGNPNGGQ
nr:unnamed protein product [Digitaria exilis]CAB3501939.1 unnamed protein product [Digitaria exilis]